MRCGCSILAASHNFAASGSGAGSGFGFGAAFGLAGAGAGALVDACVFTLLRPVRLALGTPLESSSPPCCGLGQANTSFGSPSWRPGITHMVSCPPGSEPEIGLHLA